MYLKIKGKRYKFNPNKNTLYVIIAIILIIILIFSLNSCNKYNTKIRGEKYENTLVNLPEYQVRPCVAPDGTPTCDYFSIYPPEDGDKVIYLTFDDGPSTSVTPQILDILKKNGVKATFFVLGSQAENHPELISRMAQEGHAIANHSYSHNMTAIYSSPEAFIEDINKARDVIVNIVGEDKYAGVIRFPGGAFREERAEFKEVLLENDIPYVNWNCLTGDSETKNPVSADLYNRAIRSARDSGRDSLVLLMHDAGAKQATADSLPAIIKYFKEQGYRFDVIKRK
ncbi:MAG: polysaccharide deacetylase [Clostridia bacterium]|nr:polysaccharide deacetylase [Clostridia bacterium]